jgi:hypothetical protein
MKRILPFLVLIAFVFSACRNTPGTVADNTKTPAVAPATIDTTGLAQFQAWKAQNELGSVNDYNKNNITTPSQPVQKTVVYYVPQKSTSTGTHRSSGSRSVNRDYSGGTYTSESSNTAKASQKKGWSKAAKGAAIGGVSGAALGAIINKKNRVVGGIVGGVLGGAVGYGIGHAKDKKDGRY